MIEGIEADALLADRGYDTDAIVHAAKESGMEVVIPPKKNRKEQREYDRYLYVPSAFGRKRIPAFEALAQHWHKICQEFCIIFSRCPDKMYRDLGRHSLTSDDSA